MGVNKSLTLVTICAAAREVDPDMDGHEAGGLAPLGAKNVSINGCCAATRVVFHVFSLSKDKNWKRLLHSLLQVLHDGEPP